MWEGERQKDMARKAYSEQEREQVRTALLTTVIQCIVDRGLIHSSIDVLCKKVGISKTFFYTFFPLRKNWYWRRFVISSRSCWNMPDS